MIPLIGKASLGYVDGDGPPSIVVKLASEIPELVAMSQMYGFYQREVDFYHHAAASVPSASTGHHMDIDDDAGSFVIVMDDMSNCRIADQVAGCSPDDARLAIDAIAGTSKPRVSIKSSSRPSRSATATAYRRTPGRSPRIFEPGSTPSNTSRRTTAPKPSPTSTSGSTT